MSHNNTQSQMSTWAVPAACILAALCLLLTSSGCGPVEGPDSRDLKVRVVNHYAESLFSVGYSYTDEGGKLQKGVLFSNERVAAGASFTSPEISIPSAVGSVALEFVAVSLGQTRTFDPFPVEMVGHSSDTYVIGYDYDLATASFRIKHNWNCFSCLTSGVAEVRR